MASGDLLVMPMPKGKDDQGTQQQTAHPADERPNQPGEGACRRAGVLELCRSQHQTGHNADGTDEVLGHRFDVIEAGNDVFVTLSEKVLVFFR